MTSNIYAEFWNTAHGTNKDNILSGHSLESHLTALDIRPQPASNVLCIGVGTGTWVHELASTCSIAALDIAEQALLKVADLGPVYRDPQQLPPRTFDYALSNWVSPHISDAELQRQLKFVVASLKENGVFALHFNAPYPVGLEIEAPKSDCDLDYYRLAKSKQHFWHFAQMVSNANGRIAGIVSAKPVPHCTIILTVAHIVRNK